METSESTDQSPGEPSDGTKEPDWKAEYTKLQQEYARHKQVVNDAYPLYQLGAALQEADGSEEIIKKLQEGKPLTAKEQKQAAKEITEAGEAAGLTKDEIQKIIFEGFQQFEQRQYEARRAERQMAKLHDKLGKELPGYSDLHTDPAFTADLDMVFRSIQEQRLPVPENEDPYEFALKKAYQIQVAGNPDIGKKKPAKQTEAERLAGIRRASPRSAAVPEEGSSEFQEAIRKAVPPRGSTEVGKDLLSLRSKG